ncbi:hypothetical protein FACS1894190_12970 [Spirochaetia bacterium]|nr:hypothetical protein FACS1894190_12970 [Spirochaetia bacterium]
MDADEEPGSANPIHEPPNRSIAASNESLVRVLGSKNNDASILPRQLSRKYESSVIMRLQSLNKSSNSSTEKSAGEIKLRPKIVFIDIPHGNTFAAYFAITGIANQTLKTIIKKCYFIPMTVTFVTYLIICPLVFLGGFVDSIAGGGGLITLPAYLLGGLPVHAAMGTNKFSSTMGAVTASGRYLKSGFVDIKLCIPAVIAALAGSALGSTITMYTDETILRFILLGVLPVTAFYVFKKKTFEVTGSLSRKRTLIFAALISFVIGTYDGFFGPGTGTFLIILFTAIAKIQPVNASANAKIINLSSNVGAMVVFICHSQVIFLLGTVAGLFSIAGSFIGSGLAIKKGAGLVRIVILVVLAILFVKIISDFLVAN